MSRAREVVDLVVRALVDRPGEVSITERDLHGTTVVEVVVDENDLGRVIGRQGRTAAAIRTLAETAGEADGVRVKVDIVEPDER